MSSTTLPGDFSSRREESESVDSALQTAVVSVLEVLGSLKLTCVMFALSMVIVFIGSLAQSRRDVWQVMEQYFRTWVAKVDVQDLFPPSMFIGLSQYYEVEEVGPISKSAVSWRMDDRADHVDQSDCGTFAEVQSAGSRSQTDSRNRVGCDWDAANVCRCRDGQYADGRRVW